jgi:hypothetical protein
MDRNIVRFGGISGLLFLILFIPSFLSPPDLPSAAASPQQMTEFLTNNQSQIITLNGVLLIAAGFFFLWFLGILHGRLQRSEADAFGFASVALAGGLLYLAVMLAGAAVEIVHPAAQAAFPHFQRDAQLAYLSQALSAWLYRFAFVGMSAMIAAASLGALTTGILPKWLGWFGLVCAAVALLRFFGSAGGWLSLAWIAIVSVLMLLGMFGRQSAAQARS